MLISLVLVISLFSYSCASVLFDYVEDDYMPISNKPISEENDRYLIYKVMIHGNPYLKLFNLFNTICFLIGCYTLYTILNPTWWIFVLSVLAISWLVKRVFKYLYMLYVANKYEFYIHHWHAGLIRHRFNELEFAQIVKNVNILLFVSFCMSVICYMYVLNVI
jgi:hypothetical protein